MGWDGSGNVTRNDGSRTGATVWTQARDADVLVNAPDADAHDQDLADAIENAVARDGQNSPSANLPMGGRRHTGVSDAVANTEYAAYGQLLALVSPFVSAGNVAGTGDAITLAPTPAATSYTTGRGYSFFAEAANTGAVTVAVNSLAATSVQGRGRQRASRESNQGWRFHSLGLQRDALPIEHRGGGWRHFVSKWHCADGDAAGRDQLRAPGARSGRAVRSSATELPQILLAWSGSTPLPELDR